MEEDSRRAAATESIMLASNASSASNGSYPPGGDKAAMAPAPASTSSRPADHPHRACPLAALPTELQDAIFFYLSPLDLASLAATCRDLYRAATSEHLWRALVQAEVPGARLSSPAPCPTYRALYAAHDPRWFLTRRKIWFSDRDLTGNLLVVRYDPRRGCIEGYQLLAINFRRSPPPAAWSFDDDLQVRVPAFHPSVRLHLDRPVLELYPHHLQAERQAQHHQGPHVTVLRGPNSGSHEPLHTGSTTSTADAAASSSPWRGQKGRFHVETPMTVGVGFFPHGSMTTSFRLVRPLPEPEARLRIARGFPYGDVWPPPAVPARHRVLGARTQNDSVRRQRHDPTAPAVSASPLSHDRDAGEAAAHAQAHTHPHAHAPTRRHEVSDQAFQIRNHLMARHPLPPPAFVGVLPAAADEDDDDGDEQQTAVVPPVILRPWLPALNTAAGDVVVTYSTLDPDLLVPTPERPYRGIWVGDYSAHGCEFLLFVQPDVPDEEDDDDDDSKKRREGESEAAYRTRRAHRGRLDAIKLTGDPNVPRGEYTFRAEDLGEGGFVGTTSADGPFRGARMVRSKGHVAETGFERDEYLDTRLILVSYDRIAQHWLDFNHITWYHRVDIDQFLAPS